MHPRDTSDYLMVRGYEEENDKSFVLASFNENFSFHARRYFSHWTPDDKSNYIKTMMETSLKFYDCIIACDKSDPYVLFGFMIASKSENHVFFNYTKYNFRKLGIQSQLLMPILIDKNMPITVNFTTPDSIKWRCQNKVRIIDKFQLNLMEGIEYED